MADTVSTMTPPEGTSQEGRTAGGLDLRPRGVPQPDRAREEKRIALRVENVSAWYGSKLAVSDVSLEVEANSVTALIGPSGCGKSTLIRTFNRMHEVTSSGRAEGHVFLEGEDIYAPGVDPTLVRQRIGMVFQKPNPFPTMSIAENVAAGLRFMGVRSKSEIDARVEAALKAAALWDEVKNDLKKSGMALSGGQQQRLCIARTVAVRPEVILFDEPCSALDPISTAKIEELIDELKEDYTIAIVTHNMQQAARVSDFTAFMYLGELVEYGDTTRMFTTPSDRRTQDYITGRFG